MALALSAILAGRGSAADAGGTITGSVIDGTSGLSTPPQLGGLTIHLQRYRSNALVDELVGQTDASGHFRFSGLSPDPSLQLLPVVAYGSIQYAGDPVTLTAADTHDDPITVFETTAQDPGLRYTDATLVLGSVDQAAQQLHFLELLTLTNPSDRTFLPQAAAGGGMPVNLVRFALPPGATQISVSDGLDANQLLQVDAGLASTGAVLPGDHTISFSFVTPYTPGSLSYAWNLVYPAAAAHLLVADNGVNVTAPGMAQGQSLQEDTHTLRVWNGGPLAAGVPVNITYSGLPGRSPLQQAQLFAATTQAQVLAALVVAVIAAFLPALYLWRRHPIATPPATPDDLLDQLARLDDAHDRGELEPAAYAQQRQALKAAYLASQPPDAVPGDE